MEGPEGPEGRDISLSIQSDRYSWRKNHFRNKWHLVKVLEDGQAANLSACGRAGPFYFKAGKSFVRNKDRCAWCENFASNAIENGGNE